MHFTSLFVSAALLGYVQLSHSKPIEAKGLEKRVDCDEISKYTIDYFMDNKIREPEASTCLFYTAYLSATAKRFAHSGGAAMTTIWDIWSCDHYNGDLNDDNNRLRCIFRDDNTRIEYFSHMSEAMAISCDIFATVMTNDPTSIPDDGIWATVEEPALQRTGNPGGQVDTIIAVDTSGGNVQTIWTRPGTLRVATNATEPVKTTEKPKAVKRQDDGVDRCYTPDQIQEWFGESVPW